MTAVLLAVGLLIAAGAGALAALTYARIRDRPTRAVAGFIAALQRGTPLRDALAEALGDPTVEVWYRVSGNSRWVTPDGRFVPDPEPGPGRGQTTIQRSGELVAVFDYDGRLAGQLDLIAALAKAGGLSVTNERLHAELQSQFAELRTVTDTAPSLLVNVSTEGRILNQNRAAVAVAGAADAEQVRGRFFWDVFIDPAERDDVIARFQASAPAFEAGEYENTFTNERGERRVVYWRSAPILGEDGSVSSIVAGGLDITDREQLLAEMERERVFLNAIANHAPSMLALIDETGRVVHLATNIAFERTLEYEPEDTGGHVFWERYIEPADAGDVRATLERVFRGELVGEHDHHWVTRTGRRLLVAWTCTPLPSLDERTLFLISGVDITERARQEEEIRASRARIVQAEDDARRVLERNLHDGAQQRLVAISVGLRLVESMLGAKPEEAQRLLEGTRSELAQALEELRELARGIHPAVLTDRGLGPALEALARRAPFPVELVAPSERLAPAVEAAAYYVVAESLTNVAKYGEASAARVSVESNDGALRVTVSDDGVGGADPDRGSGLRGLADRVEALAGSFAVTSPPGEGTTINAEIPLQPAHASPG